MKTLLQHKILNVLIKLLVFGGLLIVLYKQLFGNEKIEIAYAHFILNFKGNFVVLSTVVILMILNWTIESIKWKLLIDKLHPISWLDAIEGILFGVTFSLFTPSRVGEFGGRVFALNTERKEAIVSTIIGSLAQIVINVSIGALGLLLYIFIYEKHDTYLISAYAFIYILLLVTVHFCYYNIDIVSIKFSRFPILKKAARYLHIIDLYSNHDLLKLELFSLLRYLIYCIQFVLLLTFFGIKIPFASAIIIVAAIFFIQTINPINIALIDFGFRGNVAALFLGGFTDNPFAILATTITLWFINLIIPAVIGGVFAFRFRFFNED
ncbi:MAG TPA: lysylphosphatidylglycerol synthase domain-containing protein [Chitinophagales bacterium]|nr:lysylphosphatidylglycerol synthase domain-containing protein [Chitinophagales bacterium]HMZ33974.1 lysylphosphatidylglycerol synthase domain-containing protein [Chitinophagales bacterium]HNA40045.1 lysylphosphatidylglycerol synthase domain-containing protein [Chitinophagales bacterium]HNI32148.1 lysylphosphatidylglycerol synthase domain-containing protein [Chitinophagales bacterium]